MFFRLINIKWIEIGNNNKTDYFRIGFWKVILDPVQAGGPYNLTAVQRESKIVLTDVLFGDVWLCGGQSNMAFTVGQVTAASPFSLNRKIILSE